MTIRRLFRAAGQSLMSVEGLDSNGYGDRP